MANIFNRTIRITLYEVEQKPDGSVVKREPEAKKDFIVSPLTLASIDAIEQWSRQQILDTTIAALRTNTALTEDEFLKLVAVEARRTSELGWASDELLSQLKTVNGTAFIVWKALTGEQQTYEELCLKMLAKENQVEALKTVRRLDTLDSWGVSHPSQAQSPGQTKTVTENKLTLESALKATLSTS